MPFPPASRRRSVHDVLLEPGQAGGRACSGRPAGAARSTVPARRRGRTRSTALAWFTSRTSTPGSSAPAESRASMKSVAVAVCAAAGIGARSEGGRRERRFARRTTAVRRIATGVGRRQCQFRRTDPIPDADRLRHLADVESSGRKLVGTKGAYAWLIATASRASERPRSRRIGTASHSQDSLHMCPCA